MDDRAVEIMKLLLFTQLDRDLDVVELLFHEWNERTGDFRFVAVLSDGAEQYAAMRARFISAAGRCRNLFVYAGGDFTKIDMAWAHSALELLHELG